MSNCVCINIGICSLPEVIDEKIRKAQKIHRCGECGRQILPKEEYEYTKGFWEGLWEVHKTCKDCLSIRDEFFCNNHIYGMVLEHLWDNVQDLDGNVPEKCLLSLTKNARLTVCNIIDNYWEE